MIRVVCELKLRPVVASSMHPCPENWVAIGHAVVSYFAQSTQAFIAGIKCRHCRHIYNCEHQLTRAPCNDNLSLS